MQLVHATQNIELAKLGALGVDNGVECGRGFGQACQHCGFGDGDLPDAFAKIDLSCRSKAVSALPQINLIDVKLKDFVFA